MGSRVSLRLRLTAATTALAAVTFALTGAVVLATYHDHLVRAQESALAGVARSLADAAAQGPLPAPIPMPVAPGVPRVQVLDADNQVVTGDPASMSRPAMLWLAPGQTDRAVTVSNPSFLPAHRARVVALRRTASGRPVTIVVALSMDVVDDQSRQATAVAGTILSISLLVVAAAGWFIAGRALRPVERLRAEAAAITDQRDLARRLLVGHRDDEIGRLATTLNGMLVHLERSTDSQRRLVADAAHELRTPLAGITAALEVAKQHPETTEPAELVDELLAAHRRLIRLVNDLLLLATIEATGARERYRPVDLAGVVADCVRRTRPAGVELHAERLDPAVVLGDESQLARVATNLIDNALRHAARQVAVRLRVAGGYAVLTVVDDGPGVPRADRERIFDRFVRLDADRDRATGGVGLGLALVRDLVDAHGGTVMVDGDGLAGAGARFEVRLPLAEQ